jgi:maltose/moltooligosaccharide transporter
MCFVGDNLPENVTYHGICHASFLLGLVLTFTSKLPVNFYLSRVDNTAPLGIILTQLPFYFGGIAFIVTVLWTVITSKRIFSRRLAALKSTKKLV